jgi:hypothetical protein
MPYSSAAFDHYISTLVELLRPATALDIGPGAGKYGNLIRQSMADHQFVAQLYAVEIDESYVKQFELETIYDKVIVGDAIDLLTTPRIRFDFVVIGDCIEHMRKSSGVDLLNFLVYRSGYICVVYPDAYIQDDWEGHAAEAHISTWCAEDFKGWDTIHQSWEGMHLYLIKGYQPSRMTITG